MSEETYQGWSNRETWAVSLHLNNDQSLYYQLREHVEAAADTDELAKSLKEWVENLLSEEWWRDEMGATMPREVKMMRDEIGSVWRVDWDELAKSEKED